MSIKTIENNTVINILFDPTFLVLAITAAVFVSADSLRGCHVPGTLELWPVCVKDNDGQLMTFPNRSSLKNYNCDHNKSNYIRSIYVFCN